jgi:hypothetical protein
MNFATKARKRIQQALRALISYSRKNSGKEPVVFAVTKCYPTRIALYAAAFQGGWKVHFMKSLQGAVTAAGSQRPKAVFYDHAIDDPAWDQYCSSLSRDGIPFVLLAHRNPDETFLVVLAAGGYQAWGDPLTSEEIVKAVDFAGEVAGLARVPVM